MAYRWVILIFGMLAYTTSYFARSNYSGIAKFVSADFGLDKGALGLLGSVFLYAYALSQLPWGVASDRWGSRTRESNRNSLELSERALGCGNSRR